MNLEVLLCSFAGSACQRHLLNEKFVTQATIRAVRLYQSAAESGSAGQHEGTAAMRLALLCNTLLKVVCVQLWRPSNTCMAFCHGIFTFLSRCLKAKN